MKTKILLSVCLLATLALTSCLDKFDESNPNKVSFDDVAWSNLEDSEAGVTALYNSLYDDYLLSIEEMSLCSDMGFPGYGRSGSPTNSSLYIYYYHTYSNSATAVSSKWSALYTGIFRANQLIESLEAMAESGIDSQSDEWISQMATARFFRGLYHFYLHSTFNKGEVIIFDHVPNADSYYQSVSSYDDVLEFFRNDLEYAYANLGENESPKDGTITKYAAATNLGMSYLYESDFTGAKPYFEDVINNGGYSLVRDMDLLFTTAGELNDESIFEICYSLGISPDDTAYDTYATTNRLGYTSSTNCFTLPCWITDLYQTEEINTLDERNYVYDGNGDVVYEDDGVTMQKRSMPLRAAAMIATVQDDETSWYLETPTSDVITVSVEGAVGYYRKYCNWDIIDAEKNLPDGARKSGKNITVNRLADVYLMYAECLIEENNLTEALYYMNLIRDRWALKLLGPVDSRFDSASHQFNGTTYTQESLRTQLQDIDRPLEMSAEGHATRYIDLRRWGATYAKERYEKLAAETYYMAGRYVTAREGTRWNTWLVTEDYFNENSLSGTAMTFDYDTAAQNYDSDNDSYWPIPLIEEQNNPNLYNK